MRIQLAVWYRAFVYSKKANEPIYVELFNEKELSAFIQHRLKKYINLQISISLYGLNCYLSLMVILMCIFLR